MERSREVERVRNGERERERERESKKWMKKERVRELD